MSTPTINPWQIAEEMHTRQNRAWLPVTEDFYEEMLGVLPPIYSGRFFAVSEAWKHDGAGNEVLLWFRAKPDFACRMATRAEIQAEGGAL